MNDLQESLKELRDIHIPDPVSIWPLAPGWWLLLVLVPVLFFLARFLIKILLMPKYKKLALKELENITVNYGVYNNSHETCGEVALLIRKALVAKIGNKEVAGLIGEEWLAYLDRLSKTQCFTEGTGRHIISAPYSKDSDVDIDELLSATKKLLGRL